MENHSNDMLIVGGLALVALLFMRRSSTASNPPTQQPYEYIPPVQPPSYNPPAQQVPPSSYVPPVQMASDRDTLIKWAMNNPQYQGSAKESKIVAFQKMDEQEIQFYYRWLIMNEPYKFPNALWSVIQVKNKKYAISF